MCLGEPKFHDPHELTIIHARYVSLTHPNIYVVNFEEDKFRVTVSYDKFLLQLPHDVAKRELELEQEEFKKVTLNQFQRLLQ
jgi:hypothetical protein